MPKKLALLSVSDKTGIAELALQLIKLDFDIISTGGTKALLEKSGIKTIGIEDMTEFPEMMDGRVKTLHPKIHGGLLGKRNETSHMEAMTHHDIKPIDLVCVNLYPFKETILKPNVTEDEAIENIDIGGPSMIRSASKNCESVTILVDNADYQTVVSELSERGNTTLSTRKKLAAKAFRHTAAYDALIAEYLTKQVGEKNPETVTLSYDLCETLRYGENNHQRAYFYQTQLPEVYSLTQAEQHHGKALSYNNIRDADATIRILSEYDLPTAVAVKHMNPCGIGSGATIYDAFNMAYESDPISIFGGIVALNREVDLETAEKMSGIFLELIIAPSFTQDAFDVLSKKKNIRLLTLDTDTSISKTSQEVTSVLGGILLQETDSKDDDSEEWQVVTKRQPTEEEIRALTFAWSAVKHVKSNAIVIANDYQTLGIGAGQMNRIGSVAIALEQAQGKLENAVLASDAFFPMSDSVAYAGDKGIKAIIQPGGSIKDQESIDMADRYGMAMIMTGTRHFKH